MGLDIFVRILFDMEEFSAMPRQGVEFHKETDSRKETVTKTRYTIQTPDGELTQELSVNEPYPGTFLHACTEKPIKSMKDLKMAVAYEPGCSSEFFDPVKQRVTSAQASVGEDGIVGVWCPNGVFNNASRLLELEELYCLFLTEPDFFSELMEFSLKRISTYARAIAESGADVMIVGGNVAGGFLGKEMFDKYILPYEKRFFASCREIGIKTLYHNCGEIMNLVESYVAAEADWVEPFSPPPLGDAALADALATVKGRYTITGGVDQINVLQNGRVEDVIKATEAALKTGMDSGFPFVLQSADFLERDTPLENIRAYARTVRRIIS
ncbi:uroporphyrinogen decarboxylase family protein [Oceanispirochaeta sp.]|jgi:uroporphyrinogen-III decarboxylase|uniref:uroporphyrinogen decarboxylase family protein n=1 Tax=Oceanispirochaeta sp. TaxID=2035350 RepID=UPI002609FF75|nr:uroporphyrinogen decarboxylase family protein [Oceanispirochaeta sp.]MDA3955128.1 hypothetical protein [Oceanispirochaeta sp.]